LAGEACQLNVQTQPTQQNKNFVAFKAEMCYNAFRKDGYAGKYVKIKAFYG